MELLCARIGLPFERLPAVDGQESSVTLSAGRCGLAQSGRRISAGAYAIVQSHRICWDRLVRSGDDHAVILEDDVVISDDFAQYLAPDWVPRDADIVRFETYGTRVHLERGDQIVAGPRTLKRMRSRHVGAAGYLISRVAAIRMLGLTREVSDPVDELLFSDALDAFRDSVIYQMVPAPVIQGDRLAQRRLDTGWARTSIRERHEGGDRAVEHRKSGWSRVKRRLLEELRSARLGTRYQVVPHG